MNLNCAALIVLCVCLSFNAHAGKKDYKKLLKHYTHAQETYQREDFYASLNWTASYLHPNLISEALTHMNEMYQFSSTQRVENKKKWHDKLDGYVVFYVNFYGYDYKHSDLSKDNGDWNIFLTSGAERFEPVKIEKITKPSPLEVTLFPYTNIWSRHYYIYFPQEAATGNTMQLNVVGPQGTGKLVWK